MTPASIAGQTFTAGNAVSLTLPAANGGSSPYTYSISPALPTGLALSGRVINGTPSAAEFLRDNQDRRDWKPMLGGSGFVVPVRFGAVNPPLIKGVGGYSGYTRCFYGHCTTAWEQINRP